MKIYVVTDLEGISGIMSEEQTFPDRPLYETEGRRLLTAEVNTVVQAALGAGAQEVCVLDGHGGGYNFVIEDLVPGGRYVTGPGSAHPLTGLDATFDAVLLVGFHAMAGTPDAVLDHTQSSTSWMNFWVNDVCLGEIGQMALIAGHYGVPVLFCSGDEAACAEARELLGEGIVTVAVKKGFGRTKAALIAPSEARQHIAEGVGRACAMARAGGAKPFKMELPLRVRIEFQKTSFAEAYARRGAKRIDGRTIEYHMHNQRDILCF